MSVDDAAAMAAEIVEHRGHARGPGGRTRPPSTPQNTPVGGVWLSRERVSGALRASASASAAAPRSGSSTPTSQVSRPDSTDARLAGSPPRPGARNDTVEGENGPAEVDASRRPETSDEADRDRADESGASDELGRGEGEGTTSGAEVGGGSSSPSPFHRAATPPGKSVALAPEMSHVTALRESVETTTAAGEQTEEPPLQEPPSTPGNRLGLMEGWSSEFESAQPERASADPERDEEEGVDCLEELTDGGGWAGS